MYSVRHEIFKRNIFHIEIPCATLAFPTCPTSIRLIVNLKTTVENYLPATLNEEQTKALIVATISKLNITDLKTQRGLLMKELMATHKAELDTALLNSLINTML